KGITQPAFPGAIVSDKSFNGVTEWAYGVTDWFEAGLYLPLYSIDKNRGAVIDGFKLRTLFAVPDGDHRRFVYGANFEFSYNARYWDTKRLKSEVRPILGWHFAKADVIVNPIFDTSYDGIKNLEFVPATRVAFNVAPQWQVAAEEYGDYGPVRRFNTVGNQGHQLYGVVDHTAGSFEYEFGAGVGLNNASDRLTLKLIISRDLNHK